MGKKYINLSTESKKSSDFDMHSAVSIPFYMYSNNFEPSKERPRFTAKDIQRIVSDVETQMLRMNTVGNHDIMFQRYYESGNLVDPFISYSKYLLVREYQKGAYTSKEYLTNLNNIDKLSLERMKGLSQGNTQEYLNNELTLLEKK